VAVSQFVREYRTVRRAEGWGSRDPAYYLELPYRDLTGRFDSIWRIRARTYDTFVDRVIGPLESGTSHALRVLDLGAGNGWLAYRLAQRGHLAVAVDLLDDALDGLGAIRSYARNVLPVVAQFDRLPLPCECADLAVFDASFHYSTDYASTLREALRVLHARGTLVILDSPMYSDPRSGARMVQEREARFLSTYGFASNALKHEHFVTPARLSALSRELGLIWNVHQPRLDWRSRLSRAVGGVRARREPARFPLIVGTREHEA
jgi:SAM-dependent methyltransferase